MRCDGRSPTATNPEVLAVRIGTIRKLVRVAATPFVTDSAACDGYGIIHGRDGNDVYFINSAVDGCRFDELTRGQDVQYTVEDGPLGRAARVAPITAARK